MSEVSAMVSRILPVGMVDHMRICMAFDVCYHLDLERRACKIEHFSFNIMSDFLCDSEERFCTPTPD
jgi:hypothetical protein